MKRWIRSCVFALFFTGAMLLPLSEADAALSAYLKLKGQNQGQIKGGVTKKGREGMIQIDAVSHEIVSPRDPASGQATGKRQHKPFVVVKPVDKSSPLLASMLTSNENIPSWELTVYTPTSKGVELLTYKVRLTNASIASIKLRTESDGTLTEEVAFTYQKIEWEWPDGGIVAQDDWPGSSK